MVFRKTKTYEELEAIVIALQTENMKLHHSLQKLQASQDESKLLLADVSNLLPLDNCIVEWEKFIKQHNLKGNAGQKSVYFGMFLHGWRGRNSEGFWQ